MTIRPTDETGDTLPILRRTALPSGSEALTMALRGRLRLLEGDWFEDAEAGLPLHPEDFGHLREESARTELAAEIASWLTGTAGVAGIRRAAIERDPADPHSLIFRCAVIPADVASETVRFEEIL